MPIRKGSPLVDKEMLEKFDKLADAEYATAYGLLLFGKDDNFIDMKPILKRKKFFKMPKKVDFKKVLNFFAGNS